MSRDSEWTTDRQPGDDEECERLGCEDRTHPVHHRVPDLTVERLAAAIEAADAHEWDLGGAPKWAAAILAALEAIDAPLPTQASDSLLQAADPLEGRTDE